MGLTSWADYCLGAIHNPDRSIPLSPASCRANRINYPKLKSAYLRADFSFQANTSPYSEIQLFVILFIMHAKGAFGGDPFFVFFLNKLIDAVVTDIFEVCYFAHTVAPAVSFVQAPNAVTGKAVTFVTIIAFSLFAKSATAFDGLVINFPAGKTARTFIFCP
jgi:hypothetical protein